MEYFKYYLIARIQDDFCNLVIAAIEQLGGIRTTDPTEASFVLILGGDGSVLGAAREGLEAPVIVINRGHLGFLASSTAIGDTDQLFAVETLVAEFLNGNLRTTCHHLLEVDVFPKGWSQSSDPLHSFLALNDVVVKNSESRLVSCGVHTQRMSHVRDRKDNIISTFPGTLEFVSDYRADGLIISTPTGSTAYNLSAGGPIIHPFVDAIVIAPICPQGLTQRPLVLPKEYHVFVHPNEPNMYLSIDGQTTQELSPGMYVAIRFSDKCVNTVNPPETYFEILRLKLGWGIKPV